MSKQGYVRTLVKMKFMLLLMLTLCCNAAIAQENERYQAIVMHEGGRTGQSGNFFPKIFIIDSRDGHLWTWEQKAKLQGAKGNFALGTKLTYQGQVKAGKKMGDVIEQSERQ